MYTTFMYNAVSQYKIPSLPPSFSPAQNYISRGTSDFSRFNKTVRIMNVERNTYEQIKNNNASTYIESRMYRK